MIDKTYRPDEVEPRRYRQWEAEGDFAAHEASNAQPYCVMMPPPNVTGSLHIGHALTFTLQDVLIRYQRMRGRDALWQPGTDHAGIATQMVVERQLAAEGRSRADLGRAAFIDRVWRWKAESGGTIVSQLRRLGASPDWARERFTMDEGLSRAVRKVFVDLYKQGLIYRDKRLVNWDPRLHTAISDLEVEQREMTGSLWHVRYPLEGGGGITVATTRPETMLGDTAVAVHPDDERYRGMVGRMVLLPLADRVIPIIADEHSDPAKGSGAVKITPAHDFNDFEVGRRHGLPMINILDRDARLNDAVPERFRGLDRFDARKQVLAELEALGLVEKVEPNPMTVPHGDRSGVVIEPWLTDQWFVDAARLAGPALAAVRDGRTRFVPRHWENTYFNWMENIQPWCVSRQIWWGHQIPAWYGPDGQVFVEQSEAEARIAARAHYGDERPLRRDEDVLDTWFSSALWPFSTLGWPERTPALARYYPTDVLVTGFDIIFFWVARMMMMGLHFMGDVPFREIYIHALVRDAQGQKMSKSKGNIIDPLELIDRYGCDALRFTLAAQAAPGRDIKLAEGRVEGSRNFATKLWNAARFCEMNGCAPVAGFDPAGLVETINRWIAGRLAEAIAAATAALDAFRFDEAAGGLYAFVWNSFCDWYLEFAKPVLQGPEGPARAETRATAAWVLGHVLHLLHPFMPFVTEELAEILGVERGRLIRAPWPALAFRDAAAMAEIDWVVEVVSLIRSTRADYNVPPGVQTAFFIVDADPAYQVERRAREHNEQICRLGKLSSCTVVGRPESRPADNRELAAGAAQLALPGGTGYLFLLDHIDIGKERARIEREIGRLAGEIVKVEKKLANPEFVAKAPPEVVEEQSERRDDWSASRARLVEALERLPAP